MNYRIALQELGIQQLKLSSATEPITAEKDPYKIIQVHDYKSISFLRQNPNVKAASTEVIKQFALAYPELLKVWISLWSFFILFYYCNSRSLTDSQNRRNSSSTSRLSWAGCMP